jgi:hypothetical protein
MRLFMYLLLLKNSGVNFHSHTHCLVPNLESFYMLRIPQRPMCTCLHFFLYFINIGFLFSLPPNFLFHFSSSIQLVNYLTFILNAPSTLPISISTFPLISFLYYFQYAKKFINSFWEMINIVSLEQ